MISICIPIYNYDISRLLEALNLQVEKLTISCEIILIDDCSSEYYKRFNEAVITKENYIELSKNVGRSKIRNLFLVHAKYEYLLFLDCDSLIIDESFLNNYIQAIRKNPEFSVLCGGRVYQAEKPERNRLLRWLYGIKKESKPFDIRNMQPNKSFMTNNFLIKKSTFEQHPFDERITTYGHEDTLFGYELLKYNIAIQHIDNPILNGHLETNDEFLDKTVNAVKNLNHILLYVNYDSRFIDSIALLKYYAKLEEKKMIPLIRVLSFLFSSSIEKLLSNGCVNLKLFNFYKLGVFVKRQQKNI